MRIKWIKIFLFITVIGGLFTFWNSIFCLKSYDGLVTIEVFEKQEKDSVDVIFLGSSHIFSNINTEILWNKYGIASYDLGGGAQPLWNTYYYAKEALKSQTPKVFVLDVYAATYEHEYSDDGRICSNNFGLPLSLDKIHSIMTSSSKDKWGQFILQFPIYHNRYTELSQFDCGYGLQITNSDAYKGYYPLFGTTDNKEEYVDLHEIEERQDINDKEKKYLMKIIEITQEYNIPLIFVASPYALDEREAGIYNTVQDIADQYNIEFYNFNKESYGMKLDYQTDYYDSAHLNYQGASKYADWLGKFLEDNFQLTDHRGEAKYISYDIMCEDLQHKNLNYYLKNTVLLKEYFETLSEGGYLVGISVGSDLSSSSQNMICSYLASMGYTGTDDILNSSFVINNRKIIKNMMNDTSESWCFETDYTNFYLEKNAGEPGRIYINKELKVSDITNTYIIVVDLVTDRFVEKVQVIEYDGSEVNVTR